MLHAKLKYHRTSGSGETDFLSFFAINAHVGHLGEMTWTI